MPLISRPSNYNLRSQPNDAQDVAVEPIPNQPQEEVNQEADIQQIIRTQMASSFRLDNFSGSEDIEAYLRCFDQYCLRTSKLWPHLVRTSVAQLDSGLSRCVHPREL
jgi:hypothetical protein